MQSNIVHKSASVTSNFLERYVDSNTVSDVILKLMFYCIKVILVTGKLINTGWR